MAAERTRNIKRIGLQFAFWAVLGILLLTILQNFINISQTDQLSAYDDGWDDMSAFREDIKAMGVETKSLVSSPLLLPTLKILEIQPSLSLELNETRSPSRNLMRMDSSPSLLKMDTLLLKSMRLSNSSTMVERSSFWKTLAMLEALVKPTVYAIQATSSTIQTTFLNWITTTSGCVSKQARVE